MEKLVKKIKFNTVLEIITGLHIGASKDSVEIGGIDIPVVKLAFNNNQPYIPGSSIKGKMRCLLEQIAGASEVGGNDAINNLFGFSKTGQPSKLIVRDAILSKDSVLLLENCENMDMPYTEGKWENVIDRVKGTATNPRQIERVPAGVAFEVEFIINVWDTDNEDVLISMLYKGINALENDYLGGNGSRGYGQVRFVEIKQTVLSDENNWKA